MFCHAARDTMNLWNLQAVSSKAKETAEVAAAWWNFSVLFDLGPEPIWGKQAFCHALLLLTF